MRIFLSHSHLDRQIADALQRLLGDLFGQRVTVDYSSADAPGAGIGPGAPWLTWITDHIGAADRICVLLTPNSMHRPWILWESGAAAGVALAAHKTSSVVPVIFGLKDSDVPTPFQSSQAVRGDSADAGGIHRLLQELNAELGSPLTDKAFASTTEDCLPPFFGTVAAALKASTPVETVLASVPSSFSAKRLAGFWVTSYVFGSGGVTRCHADVAELTSQSDRRVRGSNRLPPPRTQGYQQPFLNEIDAELASRHLIGHWRNLSDTRYFGAIHLAVLSGECVMEGYYTSFANDVSVGSGPWKWVRIDPGTVAGVDLSALRLRDPEEIRALVEAHDSHAGPVALAAVTAGG